MKRRIILMGIVSLLIACMAVGEIFVFSLFSTRSAFATGANDTLETVSAQLTPTRTIPRIKTTATISPSAQSANTSSRDTTDLSTPNNNSSRCPDHTVALNLKRSYSVSADHPLDLGTVDVSCFNLLRLVADNRGPADVQLTLTIVDDGQPSLSTVLASETLGAGAPPLTDAFEIPGTKLNISAVTTGPNRSAPSTIDILIYGRV